MIALYVEAPFAVFRTFTAGWYRPTATFLTPSAAYGLLLNLAGIESRLREGEAGHDKKTPASLTRTGLPQVELAVGVPEFRVRFGQVVPHKPEEIVFPRVQSMFQQLHNYPVGSSGKERAESTKGNKYNITPVRREYLSNLRAVIAMRGNEELANQIQRGLAGEPSPNRYGVPFLGDNAFLIDRLELLREPLPPIRWFERIGSESSNGIHDRATRLTIVIDRANLSGTTSALFAPQPLADHGGSMPPDSAWTPINPLGNDTPAEPARRLSRKQKTND
jgi:CRISPR-associated protein Cas5t